MYTMVPFGRRDANLFGFLDDIEKSMFAPVNGKGQFRCDISEKDGEYLLEADLPGFNKEDINVEVNGEMLTISATHNEEKSEKDDDGNYIRRERRFGSFSRSFSTEGIDVENIKADYQNGVLKLDMPKAREMKPEVKKIAIGG